MSRLLCNHGCKGCCDVTEPPELQRAVVLSMHCRFGGVLLKTRLSRAGYKSKKTIGVPNNKSIAINPVPTSPSQKGPIHRWPANQFINSMQAHDPLQICLLFLFQRRRPNPQRILGLHGVCKPVRGPHVNRPSFWDDVGPLLIRLRSWRHVYFVSKTGDVLALIISTQLWW